MQSYTIVYTLAISDTNIFAGTYVSGVFLSTNNGTSWSQTGLTHGVVLALAVSGTNIFAGTDHGVFISTNNGTSWTEVNNGLTNTLVNALAVSGTNLFSGTSGGGVFLSTNNGTSWNLANTPFNDFSQMVEYGPNLFAGTQVGVFLSTNNGTSWTKVNNGLMNASIRSLAVSGTSLFAGTSGRGVWGRPLSEMVPVELTSFTASANGKEVTLSWSTATELNNQGFEVQRKFGSNDIATIGSVKGHGTTTSPNNYNYVDKLTDAGKYFYRLKQIDYGGTFEYSNEIEVEVIVLDKFTLEHNYPNPFNPSTKISWQSPVGSQQTLTVFDVLGNVVAILMNEFKLAGSYEVEFDGSNLASGIYFYQLRVGNFIDTKKMILLR